MSEPTSAEEVNQALLSQQADQWHQQRQHIAELEALTQPFTQSELAQAEEVLNAAMPEIWTGEGEYKAWLRSTIQAIAEALGANSREQKAVDG